VAAFLSLEISMEGLPHVSFHPTVPVGREKAATGERARFGIALTIHAQLGHYQLRQADAPDREQTDCHTDVRHEYPRVNDYGQRERTAGGDARQFERVGSEQFVGSQTARSHLSSKVSISRRKSRHRVAP